MVINDQIAGNGDTIYLVEENLVFLQNMVPHSFSHSHLAAQSERNS